MWADAVNTHSHLLEAKLNISGVNSVFKCLCPVRAQIFLCPATRSEPLRGLSMRKRGRIKSLFFLGVKGDEKSSQRQKES